MNTNDAVISYILAFLLLFHFNYSNYPALYDAAWKSRSICKHHDIKWVTIFSKREWYKAKIKWKNKPGWQRSFQLKSTCFMIVNILVPAVLWCFNYSLYFICTSCIRTR